MAITETRSEGSTQTQVGPSTGEVEVLEANPSGYVLEMTFDDVPLQEFVAAGVGPGLDAGELEEVAQSFVIRFAAGRNGTFLRVLNEDQLRDLTSETLDLVQDQQGDDPRVRAVVEQIRPVVTSSSFLQEILPQDIALFHAAHGVALQGETSSSTRVSLPSPFGGSPIPARATTRLVDGGDDANCREVEITTTANPVRLREVLETNLRRFDESGDPVALPPASLESTERLIYDPGRGLVVRAEGTKRIKVGGRSRIDRIAISATGFDAG